ncbi:transcription factor bHLH120 [Argentina anserina]|uniref:transcription factor bHLH120 n=1 Tax=Argentina anserina TaxID=57926 RepID=UPI0021763FB8|nr:transcription factor bHLH120 [Potentilla anserina]
MFSILAAVAGSGVALVLTTVPGVGVRMIGSLAEAYANNVSLRSHLPLEYLKGKRSISDHVYQAANFIKHIQKNIEELQKKRDELKIQCNSSRSSTGALVYLECPAKMGDTVVLVRPGCVGLEVVVNTPLKQGLPLSRLIDILVAEGLGIVSCKLAERNQRLLYTLESEVSNGEIIDIPELQNRLIAKCTSEPGFI